MEWVFSGLWNWFGDYGGAVGVIERIPLGLGAGFILLRCGNLSLSSDMRIAVVYLVSDNGNIQYLGVYCQYEESVESTLRPACLLRAICCLIA